jgi:hypothetical protein
MDRYIDEHKSTAGLNEDTVDPITMEALALVERTSRFGSVALEASGCVRYWSTEALSEWLSSTSRPTNPLTRRVLTDEEIRYVEHYRRGYELEKAGKLNVDETALYNKYIKANGGISPSDHELMRYIFTPYTFSNQFKEYQRDNSVDFNVERQGATDDLQDKPDGTWLIRYSSYNAVHSYDYIKKQGIRFFVFSVVRDKKITHYLFIHRPGKGWAMANGGKITINKNSITYSPLMTYCVCFFDLLTAFIDTHNLDYNRYIRND